MDKRESERIQYEQMVDLTVSVLQFKELKSLNLKGNGIDISKTGLGLRVDYPLEPGHVLRFSNGIGHKTGIVKWSRKTDNSAYSIGIKFV
ncbi:MAG: hypothetical protein A2X59_07520 [Nitrospirae bacterium GWC2_42_7]|nr:MAG: hypothetical protein A2X59_07520 [Nitrospirae bacterium GWC2_42_7]